MLEIAVAGSATVTFGLLVWCLELSRKLEAHRRGADNVYQYLSGQVADLHYRIDALSEGAANPEKKDPERYLPNDF